MLLGRWAVVGTQKKSSELDIRQEFHVFILRMPPPNNNTLCFLYEDTSSGRQLSDVDSCIPSAVPNSRI